MHSCPTAKAIRGGKLRQTSTTTMPAIFRMAGQTSRAFLRIARADLARTVHFQLTLIAPAQRRRNRQLQVAHCISSLNPYKADCARARIDARSDEPRCDKVTTFDDVLRFKAAFTASPVGRFGRIMLALPMLSGGHHHENRGRQKVSLFDAADQSVISARALSLLQPGIF